MTLRLALFEPDIPQNTGAVLRLAACLGAGVDVIGPCGFVWSDRRLRRATQPVAGDRLLLLTTGGDIAYTDFAFRDGDTLLLGRESSGAPDFVHAAADARLVIPLQPGLRSLNLALAAAIALGEALRQVGALPAGQPAKAVLTQRP